MVRIRSEHAIGFLKGRWHSLKHLRVRIADERSHKFATYWIAACVGLHAFAMQCEEDEHTDNGSEYEDPFIAEGLSSSSSDDDGDSAPLPRPSQNANLQRLRVAKAQREKLKRALFRAKDRRRQRREQDQASMESLTDSSE
jgi:hypothetical protein